MNDIEEKLKDNNENISTTIPLEGINYIRSENYFYQKREKVGIKILEKDIDFYDFPVNYKGHIPQKSTEYSAAYDLSYCGVDVIIQPGETVVLSTCVKLEIPPHLCGLVLSRSGMASKHGIIVLNSPGLIDPDYRGEIMVILHNLSKKAFKVTEGMRIAQIIFLPYANVDFIVKDKLTETRRDEGGLGSTGY
ncbi:MAG: dUTP diphosphatase [Candidatus Aenigmatarchaeota archaeon]